MSGDVVIEFPVVENEPEVPFSINRWFNWAFMLDTITIRSPSGNSLGTCSSINFSWADYQKFILPDGVSVNIVHVITNKLLEKESISLSLLNYMDSSICRYSLNSETLEKWKVIVDKHDINVKECIEFYLDVLKNRKLYNSADLEICSLLLDNVPRQFVSGHQVAKWAWVKYFPEF